MKSCADDPRSACPFAQTEESDSASNLGCLPSQNAIIKMRVEGGKTWACHSDQTKPCTGALRVLKEKGLPTKVIDSQLLTLADDWGKFEG